MMIAMSPLSFRVSIVILAVALSGSVSSSALYSQQPEVGSGSEPDNLPVSNATLRRNVHEANLIVRGKVIAYEAPTYKDHRATPEKTTLSVEETYAGGTFKTITYLCLCHYEETPPSAAMIGHDKLVFLSYDKIDHSWYPATHAAVFYYHDSLRTRLTQLLKGTK